MRRKQRRGRKEPSRKQRIQIYYIHPLCAAPASPDQEKKPLPGSEWRVWRRERQLVLCNISQRRRCRMKHSVKDSFVLQGAAESRCHEAVGWLTSDRRFIKSGLLMSEMFDQLYFKVCKERNVHILLKFYLRLGGSEYIDVFLAALLLPFYEMMETLNDERWSEKSFNMFFLTCLTEILKEKKFVFCIALIFKWNILFWHTFRKSSKFGKIHFFFFNSFLV